MIDFCLSSDMNTSAYDIANLPLFEFEEDMVIGYLSARPDATSKNILLVRELHRGHAQHAKEIAGTMKNQISFGTKRTTQWAEMAKRLKSNPTQIL